MEIFENEVVILDCWIEIDKGIIANCDTEDDEFDDDKELAELSLKDYSERKELFEIAISALKEIKLYKDGKLCPVPEDVYSRQCSELDAYKEIGTVEECREAVEKQKPMKPEIYTDTVQTINGSFQRDVFECPVCGSYICNVEDEIPRYCCICGQALEESEE